MLSVIFHWDKLLIKILYRFGHFSRPRCLAGYLIKWAKWIWDMSSLYVCMRVMFSFFWKVYFAHLLDLVKTELPKKRLLGWIINSNRTLPFLTPIFLLIRFFVLVCLVAIVSDSWPTTNILLVYIVCLWECSSPCRKYSVSTV